MDIFGEQFYPTPKALGRKMVEGLKLSHMRVLDPSAGRGDLLDSVNEAVKDGDDRHYWARDYQELYAIEIDPDLRGPWHHMGFQTRFAT